MVLGRIKPETITRCSQAPGYASVESFVNERVPSFRLKAAGGKALTVVCPYAPHISSDYPVFLESLNGVLEGVQSGDSFVLRGDFNTMTMAMTVT